MKNRSRTLAGFLLAMLLASSCAAVFAKYTPEEEERARRTREYNESKDH
jgi:hypothetical protein